MSILNSVIKAFRKTPDTVKYPFGPLVIPKGFRGAIVIDTEKCTGCGLCVRDCPAEGLELIKESRQDYQLIHYPARCAYCGQCEDSCARGAISHSNDLVDPTYDSDEWVVALKHESGD
jgi:formate hydrogenlyase subunit 6/NADH:ubiquinone oxidoreductase subunit I